MKRFCADLRKHPTEKINSIKKDMLHLEKKIQKTKTLPDAQQEFNDMFSEVGNNIGKYRCTAHIIFNLR